MKPETRAATYSKAKAEWLPLHVAMLRFFPTFAATPKAFEHEMSLLATRHNPEILTLEDAPFVVRHSLGGVAFIVDAIAGEIELSSDPDHEIFDEWHRDIRSNVSSFPRAFEARMFRPEYVAAAEEQHQLALSVITSQRRSFDLAVLSGAAELFGRWRDLKAPFEAIQPDQWERFRPLEGSYPVSQVDICLMTPSGAPSEEKIYSVHVQGHRQQVSASNRAVQDCEQFLLDRMKSSPNQRILESDLEIEARKFWTPKQLPKRKFQDCYRKAKSQMKTDAWQKRGRLPNLIQSTH